MKMIIKASEDDNEELIALDTDETMKDKTR